MDVSSTGCHTVVSAGYPDPVDRRSGPPSPSPLVGPTMFSDGSPSFSESNHRWCQNVTSSSDHRGHQKVTSSVQPHPSLWSHPSSNHRGHQNVTCSPSHPSLLSHPSSNHRGHQNVTCSPSHPSLLSHPLSNQNHPFLSSHRGHQNVTCRLYTPLHYRIGGQGSWAALHMVEYTDGRSLYQAACDRAYHGVIAIGHW